MSIKKYKYNLFSINIMELVTVYYNVFTPAFLKTITKAGLIDTSKKDFDQSDLSFRTHPDLPRLLDEFEDNDEYVDEVSYNEPEAITRKFPRCLIPYSRLIRVRYEDPDLEYTNPHENTTYYTMKVDSVSEIYYLESDKLNLPNYTVLSESEKDEIFTNKLCEVVPAYRWLNIKRDQFRY
jgi:hypothetical protein